jgi:DNA polymerase-3 subunit delta
VTTAARTAPAWLLLGPEQGEKTAFIDKLKERLAATVGEPPECTRFYAGETRMAEVVQCLANKSLFAKHRLVIVNDAEEVKRAEEVAMLTEYLSAPAPDATLLLVSAALPSEIDRRIVGDQKKKVAGAIAFECQKIFWEMFENQKQGWVAGFFKQRKISIAADAVDLILDMVENNTRDMRVECERLALFFGPDSSIEPEDVERYLYHSKEENVFTLFDRLCERDLTTCVEVLDKILLSREAEPTQLVSGLLMQFRRLASLTRMLAENYEPTEAFAKLRLWNKRGQKTYLEGTRHYAAEDLERIVMLLASFDERLRSIRTDLHALLLNLLVYYIVQRAGQGAWQQAS